MKETIGFYRERCLDGIEVTIHGTDTDILIHISDETSIIEHGDDEVTITIDSPGNNSCIKTTRDELRRVEAGHGQSRRREPH